jgi:Flp pilus assembly protein TadG
MNGRRRGIFGRDRSAGQALVEFALAIPIFLILVFGLIDIGRLVYVNNAISQGAREGARYGSVQYRAGSAASRADVGAYTVGVMTAVPNAAVTVTCERNGASVTACRTNDLLVVNVTSPVSMFTPLIGQLVGTVNVSSTAKVMVNQ